MNLALSDYIFAWEDAGLGYDVYYRKQDSGCHVCRVFPYKGEAHHQLSDPKKMYTVKAANYPGIGNLEQMVKGSDLLDYVDSVRTGRGM